MLATTVTAGDWRLRSGIVPSGFGLFFIRLAFGIFGPRKPVPGTELSGGIEALGSAVTQFKVGDRVFAFCGGLGCHAEYRAVREDSAMAHKPANLTWEEAAALSFGGTTALYFLRDRGKVQPGERVLINGASGSVGTAAIQIARHFGAHVTAVCSGANAEMVRSLGAERVIDHTCVRRHCRRPRPCELAAQEGQRQVLSRLLWCRAYLPPHRTSGLCLVCCSGRASPVDVGSRRGTCVQDVGRG